MSKTGRPPLPETHRKECTFRIRMTEEDQNAIRLAANNCGKTASEWAREILLKMASQEEQCKR